MAKKIKFEDVDVKLLKFMKPCKHGHQDPLGRNIGFIRGGCVACRKHYPEGPFEHIIEGIEGSPPTKRTKEESDAAHILQVMAWNKRNKEKRKGYQNRYNKKPERKELLAARAHDTYINLTPEEKKKRNRISYERHLKKCETEPGYKEWVAQKSAERRRARIERNKNELV